jgi:hypothetical protein
VRVRIDDVGARRAAEFFVSVTGGYPVAGPTRLGGGLVGVPAQVLDFLPMIPVAATPRPGRGRYPQPAARPSTTAWPSSPPGSAAHRAAGRHVTAAWWRRGVLHQQPAYQPRIFRVLRPSQGRRGLHHDWTRCGKPGSRWPGYHRNCTSWGGIRNCRTCIRPRRRTARLARRPPDGLHRLVAPRTGAARPEGSGWAACPEAGRRFPPPGARPVCPRRSRGRCRGAKLPTAAAFHQRHHALRHRETAEEQVDIWSDCARPRTRPGVPAFIPYLPSNTVATPRPPASKT